MRKDKNSTLVENRRIAEEVQKKTFNLFLAITSGNIKEEAELWEDFEQYLDQQRTRARMMKSVTAIAHYHIKKGYIKE